MNVYGTSNPIRMPGLTYECNVWFWLGAGWDKHLIKDIWGTIGEFEYRLNIK